MASSSSISCGRSTTATTSRLVQIASRPRPYSGLCLRGRPPPGSNRTRPQSEPCSTPFGASSALTPKPLCNFTVTAMVRDIVATRNEKGRAPYSGAHHPMEEVVTQHGGGALGEKQREQVGAQLVQNFSGMNESCDSRSNIRTVLFCSTPCRTKSRPKIHNRRTSPLRPCHSASPYL